jgi:hemerythrin-like domain-containing protein
LLEAFCELLSSHIRREEKELFEEIQRTLPREVLDRAGKEIDRRAVRICM